MKLERCKKDTITDTRNPESLKPPKCLKHTGAGKPLCNREILETPHERLSPCWSTAAAPGGRREVQQTAFRVWGLWFKVTSKSLGSWASPYRRGDLRFCTPLSNYQPLNAEPLTVSQTTCFKSSPAKLEEQKNVLCSGVRLRGSST